MGLGLGDFDKDSVHNLSTPTKRMPNMGRFPGNGEGMGGRDPGGFPFPTDFNELDGGDDVFVADDEALENVITATIANLSEEDKTKALRAYYRHQLRSESVEQKLNERKTRMINRARMHEWVKYLLIFVSSLLLISLTAVVVTIIYTSLTSGTMSESGILSAIVTFFSEIVRMLLSS